MQDELWKAIISCDKRYDGQFFYGVLTTGIFCRPSCKSRTPKREHVRIFSTTEDARTAGLRPCKRCNPEVHNWNGSDEELVVRAKNLIESCFHEPLTLTGLSMKLHVSPYYFHRTFRRTTGKTPAQHLVSRRIDAAKLLLVVALTTNLLGMQISGSFSLILSGLVLLLLLATIGLSLPAMEPAPFAPNGIKSIGSACVLIFWAFFGWESITHLVPELKKIWDMPVRPTEVEIRQLACDWSPWKSYASYYLVYDLKNS
ncbi:amino acid permease [Effusibacillus consociatus]|uniref:Amino acid permease n=1 Tax=Effusibacillus consociatus TaxID=1117041 RepID=A0ABV9Q4Y3_9BACL